MECIIFIGIQASGKSTFYKEHFFSSHMRINLDMLRTRHRETTFIENCLKTQLPFVIDNTNPTLEEREKYIRVAKEHKFRVIGYFFEPNYELSLERNERRVGKEKIPEVGIISTLKKMKAPSYSEGFDEIYTINLECEGVKISELKNEIFN
ncbi:ATP-binding protein [Neobacillus mesonae]|nr:ATP-binding protein [Neobacillus mesonae]